MNQFKLIMLKPMTIFWFKVSKISGMIFLYCKTQTCCIMQLQDAQVC